MKRTADPDLEALYRKIRVVCFFGVVNGISKESIRVARTTRELLKKFAAAYRHTAQVVEDFGLVSSASCRGAAAVKPLPPATLHLCHCVHVCCE